MISEGRSARAANKSDSSFATKVKYSRTSMLFFVILLSKQQLWSQELEAVSI